jgi:hypothetical protein
MYLFPLSPLLLSPLRLLFNPSYPSPIHLLPNNKQHHPIPHPFYFPSLSLLFLLFHTESRPLFKKKGKRRKSRDQRSIIFPRCIIHRALSPSIRLPIPNYPAFEGDWLPQKPRGSSPGNHSPSQTSCRKESEYFAVLLQQFATVIDTAYRSKKILPPSL